MFLCVDPKISPSFDFEQQLFFGSRVKTSQPPCVIHFHNRQELSLLMVRPWIYVVKSKSQIILTKLTNCYVFCLIFGCPSKKNSIGCRSDNIDASGLPNTSSERLGQMFFREHVWNSKTFKIGCPSPFKIQLNQICVTKKMFLRLLFFSREYTCFDCFWQNEDTS